MKTARTKNDALLLPTYFKKIGLGIMTLALVSILIFKSLSNEVLRSQKDLIKVFTLDAFILGLLFVVLAKNKVEDEMTIGIRLKSMAWSFACAAAYVIIMPVVDLLFKEPLQILSGAQLVLIMLLNYLIYNFVQRRTR